MTMRCNGAFKLTTHDEVECMKEPGQYRCPTCGWRCYYEETVYEQATADDPHPGELYRYPAWNLLPGQQMVMYRGDETWMRWSQDDFWRLLKPWRVPEPVKH